MGIETRTRRVTVCDAAGCEAEIECSPAVVGSGWMKYGNSDGLRLYFCPDHAHLAEAHVREDEARERGKKR